METRDIVVVGLIFLITLSLRLFLAFQTPYLIGDESFHWMRQVESIKETGHPLTTDPLFAGGRSLVSFPLFAYVLTAASFLGPLQIWGRVISNLLASSLVLLAFLICLRTTRTRYVAYLTSFFAGFVPIFWQKTVGQVSIYAVTVPLFVLCVYLFLEIAQHRRQVVGWYVAALLTYSLLHPTVLILVAGLLVYILLLKVEGVKVRKAEWELVLFSALVAFIAQVVIYRHFLLMHGIGVLWQNIPGSIVDMFFTQTTFVQAFYRIGEIPVFFGMLIIAKYLFREKDRTVYLLISFAMVVGFGLWQRLLEPAVGMMILGAILVLLFSFYYTIYLDYVPSTRFSQFLPVLKTIFFLSFVITSVLPAIDLVHQARVTSHIDEHMGALEWLRQQEGSGRVMALPMHGAMIAAVANKSIVIDDRFLGVDDAQKRLDDVEMVITSPYESIAAETMQEWNADYLYVDRAVLDQRFNFTRPAFIDPRRIQDCFAKVYGDGVRIYKRTCEVRRHEA